MKITQNFSLEMANFIKKELAKKELFGNYLVYGAYTDEIATIIVEEGLTPQECEEYKNYGIIIKEQVQVFGENELIIINLHIAQYKTIWLESLNNLSQIICELIKDFAEEKGWTE